MLVITLIFLFLLYNFQVSSKTSMVIVWGQPDSINLCNNSGTMNFTNCIGLCLNQSECIIATMNLSDSICYLCYFQAVKNVIQKSYEDKMKVGMKINISDGICQAQYPLEGQVDHGYLQSNEQQSLYNISFSNGLWTLSFSTATCPTGWQIFNRFKGPWCMNFFYSTTSYHNWTDANNQCQTENATLSGIETSSEHSYINATANSEWKTNFGLIWLGARRVAECVYPVWNATICSNKSTVFEWTDGFTTGTDGFNFWYTTSPDGYFNNLISASDNCLEMWMNYGSATGYLDDATCSLYGTYQGSILTMCFSGYVCGKQALMT